MTIRSAGNTLPPPKSKKTINATESLGRKSVKKIWKKLVARFKVPPTKSELNQKKKLVKQHYENAARLFEAKLRKKENDQTIRISVIIQWDKINSLKYFITIIMLRRGGPGSDSVSPPQSPPPPKSPL